MAGHKDTRIRRVTKSTVCQVRRLKVKAGYHGYQLAQAKRTAIGQIELKGQWLIKAGFGIDQPVTVREMDKCLVVTVE
jgi:toxic protein SymE